MARNRFDIDEELESPFNVAHLKRALVYAGKYKKKIAAGLALSVISIVASLFPPVISKVALDDAIPNGDVRLLLSLGGLMLFSVAVSVFFAQRRSIIMTKVGQDIIYDIRRDLFEHLQRLSFEYYDGRPHGKILVRVVNYINNVSDLMTNGIINFVLETLSVIFIAVFMFFVSWELALVILAGVPLFLAIILVIKNKQRKAWQAVSNKTSNLNAYLHESIVGVKISQIFTREEENAEIFDRLSRSYRKEWMRAVAYSNLVHPTVDNVSALVRGGVYVVGLTLFITTPASLGTVAAMSNYSWRFWQPLLTLSNLMNAFITAVAYLERIFEALDEPVAVKDAPNAVKMPVIDGRVTFDNVTFSYEKGADVLNNLSFEVKAGESVALVGPTGAGKTTIVSLISRFYNLNGGRVLIDGTDISGVTLTSLREQMGIMLQDSFIFSGTVMFNVKYGKRDATDEEAREACRIVGIDDYITSLKDGYDTEIKERGAGLSSGQKQLIAFARTILANPRILVLDEATSSIDAKSERSLQEGINYLLKGRTSFVIAHRLSTVRNCDRIMYVSDGGITEEGAHGELMAKKGDYYRLYTTQSGTVGNAP
ncbi:MAG: ABC transporter ATP-binding protein/permease [Oscillospiraceae bacterium]|jgi:ATP-binding cassette subfamily B protein|nr:ABC transporter ATP-binding protein/permease [Oscillospiraceae bacterium]